MLKDIFLYSAVDVLALLSLRTWPLSSFTTCTSALPFHSFTAHSGGTIPSFRLLKLPTVSTLVWLMALSGSQMQKRIKTQVVKDNWRYFLFMAIEHPFIKFFFRTLSIILLNYLHLHFNPFIREVSRILWKIDDFICHLHPLHNLAEYSILLIKEYRIRN